MKKVMLTAVVALGSLTAFASNAKEMKFEATQVVLLQDDFSEISVSDLPTAVTEALAKQHPTATVKKAYVNKAKQYKLEVALQDGTSGTLYADENGKWIDV